MFLSLYVLLSLCSKYTQRVPRCCALSLALQAQVLAPGRYVLVEPKLTPPEPSRCHQIPPHPPDPTTPTRSHHNHQIPPDPIRSHRNPDPTRPSAKASCCILFGSLCILVGSLFLNNQPRQAIWLMICIRFLSICIRFLSIWFFRFSQIFQINKNRMYTDKNRMQF